MFRIGEKVEFTLTPYGTLNQRIISAEVVQATEGVVLIKVQRGTEDYWRNVEASRLKAKEQVGA